MDGLPQCGEAFNRCDVFCRRIKSGMAALEFGLLAPVFLIVLAGTVDIGSALYTRMSLTAIVAAGADYALVHAGMVTSASGVALANNIATVVTTSGVVVVNNGPTVTITNGTPSPSGTAANANSCYCPTGSPTSWIWGSTVTCGNACTGGGVAGKFVTVTASYNFTPLFLSYVFVQKGMISAGVMVQTQ
jgi:Flp pilus assembly protein TadG